MKKKTSLTKVNKPEIEIQLDNFTQDEMNQMEGLMLVMSIVSRQEKEERKRNEISDTI